MRFLKALCATLAMHVTLVFAAVPATVEAVQSPAWIDRGGFTLPLAAGMALENGDVVRTGGNARVYLLLAEGSRVKLGEATRFTLRSGSLDATRYFRSVLEVAAGAFRFTTGVLGRANKRDVAIRVGTATVGIRGTDVWGKTDRDGDLVALLEGHITVTRSGEVTGLSQPGTYFDAPRDQAAQIKTLSPETLKVLARQTEIESGDGASRAAGKWKVLAATVETSDAALALYDRLREAGFVAHIRPVRPVVTEGSGWRYQVLLGGFPSAMEARIAALRLKPLTDLEAEVTR